MRKFIVMSLLMTALITQQVLAETQSGNRCFSFFELPAIFMTGLHIKRVGLAWAAAHPQQNTMSATTRILCDFRRQCRKPALRFKWRSKTNSHWSFCARR